MAHFAKVGADNVVESVCVVHNNELLDENEQESEQKGIDFLKALHKTDDVWVQTSYNTKGGVHKLGGTPLRKNYAGPNFTYDKDRDAFIPEKPFPSFVLDEDTCEWKAPVSHPNEGIDSTTPDVPKYDWDEATTSWKEIKI